MEDKYLEFYRNNKDDYDFTYLSIIDSVYASLEWKQKKYNDTELCEICDFVYNVYLKDEDSRSMGYYSDCVVSAWEDIKAHNTSIREFLCEIYKWEV
jgi:hypothetical protein